LVDEQFIQRTTPEDEDAPIMALSGRRRKRAISSESCSPGPSDGEDKNGKIMEISSDAEETSVIRHRTSKSVKRPKKWKKTQGSPKLVLGACPTSEDYFNLYGRPRKSGRILLNGWTKWSVFAKKWEHEWRSVGKNEDKNIVHQVGD